MLREAIREFLGRVDELYRLSEPIPLIDLEKATDLVELSLLDWMGPGRDEAFLVLFLLGGGRLKELIADVVCIWHRQDDLAGAEGDVARTRRQKLNNRASNYTTLCGTNFRKFGYVPSKTGVYGITVADDDGVLSAILADALANQDPILARCGQEMLAAQRRSSCVLKGLDGVYSFALEPVVDFRTLLMGELAQPWEVLPPPYGPYVPARRL